VSTGKHDQRAEKHRVRDAKRCTEVRGVEVFPKAPSPKRPEERLWKISRGDREWSAVLTRYGRPWGWEVRLLSDRSLRVSRRFALRAEAEEWASAMLEPIQRATGARSS